jgi:hypothetical protein
LSARRLRGGGPDIARRELRAGRGRILGALPMLVICIGCVRWSASEPFPHATAELEARAAEYAAGYVRLSRPNARFALDTTSNPGFERSASEVARLARILGADVLAARDSAITCGATPDSCRMRGDFDAIVGVRVDTIADSTAEATIELRATTGLPRVPIVWETRKIRLVRRGDRWSFDRELWLEVS